LKQTYDSELDEAHRWFVDVSLTLFDTPERATRDLDSSCNSFARGGASGGPVRARKGVYCISSVTRQSSDPQGLYLPSNFYSSWLFVRRDRLVVRLYERHKGSAKSAKSPIIQDLAERLGKLNAAPEFRE
jgi:hypothetical protein